MLVKKEKKCADCGGALHSSDKKFCVLCSVVNEMEEREEGCDPIELSKYSSGE